MKKVLLFDTETTGIDKEKDQIIELALKMGDDPARSWRMKPTIPISPEAQEIHRISMEDLIDCPDFKTIWKDEIEPYFREAEVYGGYNIQFDLAMTQSECKRAGFGEIDLSQKIIVDPFDLWKELEPRTLTNAHRRFVGYDFSGAHSAAQDIDATKRVLDKMLEHFGLGDKSWKEIETICFPGKENWIGPSNHVQWSENRSFVCLSFGKHKGIPIHRVPRDYRRWIMNQGDMPQHVKNLILKIDQLDPERFYKFLRESSPKPA